MLSVAVYDKDTLSDDLMGDHQINLNKLKLEEEAEKEAEAYEMTTKNGEAAGKVVLSFSRRAVPEGAFEGILHVTVHRIEGFSDTVGVLGVRRCLFLCRELVFCKNHLIHCCVGASKASLDSVPDSVHACPPCC